MAELAALNVKITGDASGIKAAANSAQKSVETFTKSAESSARVFERAFAQNERSVDRLRKSIDPLYAASKRYEAAVETLDNALRAGTITQAQHARLLDQTGAAYLTAGGQAARAATSFSRASIFGGAMGSRLQQVGFQLQDVAIQLQAGTRASVVFAQQGSQIASVFGPVGAIIGTLAAVGIPALAFAFSNAGTQTKDFATALGDAKNSLSALREAAAVFSSEGIQGLIDKYGELNAEVLQFIELQRQVAMREAIESARGAMSALLGEMNGFEGVLNNIADLFPAMGEEAYQLQNALDSFGRAQSMDQMISRLETARGLIIQATGGIDKMSAAQFEFYNKILQAEDALRQMNHQGSLAQGWLSTAISGASSLAGKLWDAAAAAAKVREEQAAADRGNLVYSGRGADPRQFTPGGANSFGGSIYGTPSPARGGGGGGGGSNPVMSELESLRQSLMSQEEAQIASFTRQQEALQAALEQRLITQQEYQALMEESQRKHAEALAQIDVWRYGDGLQRAGAFFGSMADAFANGNEEMMRVSKVFGAAEALINAWRAYSQTLADPSLPWFAKFAAATKVLAAGMGAVNAIKGAGKGGSGGGSAPANSNAAPPAPLEVRLNGISPGSLYSGSDIGSLLDRLSDEAGDRGYRLMIAR